MRERDLYSIKNIWITGFSHKKDVLAETDVHRRNEEKFTSKKKRSVKRNAEPISDEESVRRKCYKKETEKALTKTQLGEDINHLCNISAANARTEIEEEEHARKNSLQEESHAENGNENETPLNEYEVKTIGNIHKIREKCKEFDHKINNFTDVTGSKQFLFVDENLQKNIEKLDGIDARESTRIRKERRCTVKYICLLIDKLEVIAKKNQEQLKPGQLEAPPVFRAQFLEGKKEEWQFLFQITCDNIDI